MDATERFYIPLCALLGLAVGGIGVLRALNRWALYQSKHPRAQLLDARKAHTR